ncbi:hypothetical protein C8D95_10348 [Silicimonas algicola]|uniref:7-cyano-7-deazaguanine synthase in queuosine biosynthesis n=1 Tax=Silicimonas algicola TaxID=1826607 RepID=A0A316GPF0_9RHOB|nr:hypothetical protein C8D95_10348 [Silicimonas algicola]
MLTVLTERLIRVPKARTLDLTVVQQGSTSRVHFGDAAFDVTSDLNDIGTHDVFDFALFGTLAVAVRNNWNVRTDLPITEDGLAAARRVVDIFDLWRVRRCYPVTIEATNLVPAPVHAPRHGGLICLSGGIDSTYAAMKDVAEGRAGHGLLVAGADYPRATSPGFVERRGRVARLAEVLGLELVTAETTVRDHKLYFNATHTCVLAMMLAFHAQCFRDGSIAADFTLAQEYGYTPWGNSRPIVEALGSTWFPIHHAGGEAGRTAKVRAIVDADPDLMRAVSVCQNKEIGGNCGTCEKCVRTKLNLVAAGVDPAPYFEANPDLAEHFAAMTLPNYPAGLRRHMVFLKDLEPTLDDAALRTVLTNRLDRLRRKITPTGKA